jgi:membrane-bound lytic murein transglycosylase D
MRSSHPRSRRFAFLLIVGLELVVARAAQARGDAPRLEFENGLEVPRGLDARVRFWIDVFTRYSLHDAIVQDRDDPSVVLAVVPLSTGSAEELNAVKQRYQDLAGALPRADGRERQRILQAFGPPLDPNWIARERDRIRVYPGQREVFQKSLQRSVAYLASIKRIIREAALPTQLAYLPHVESSFDVTAESRAGAVGLWQLMPDTAREFIRVDAAVDERLHPYKATEAAIRYLRGAFETLGSWPLAITSYNQGIAGMKRAVDAVGTDDLVEVIRNHDSPAFGFASKNFYAQFLAAAHVAEHHEYYFPDLKFHPAHEYVVRKGDTLWEIAKRHGVTIDSLRSSNRSLSARLQLGQRLLISG